MPRYFLSFLTAALAFAASPALPAQTAPAAAPGPSDAAGKSSTLSTPQGKILPPGSVDIAAEPSVRVVTNVLPAVVNITAEATAPQYTTAYDLFFRRYRIRNAPEASIGSGLIVSADGYILTNAHVVALAETEKIVSVTLNSGSKYQAHIVEADEDADLALLKIDDKSIQFPYFDLSYASPNYLGETVIAIGSPAGYQGSASRGILSAKDRTFTAEGHTFIHLLQTDAAINPGNSGGPLVDLNGGLVGINSAKLAGTAIESIGFAIPNDIVIPWANNAVAVARGLKPPNPSPALAAVDNLRQRLGLSVKPLDEDRASELGVDGGLVITGVQDGSPAADSGLEENMIIVGVGNSLVTDDKNLPAELQHLRPGSKVRLKVIVLKTSGPFILQRGYLVLLTAR